MHGHSNAKYRPVIFFTTVRSEQHSEERSPSTCFRHECGSCFEFTLCDENKRSNLGSLGEGARKITECVPCKASLRGVNKTFSIFWDVKRHRPVLKLATFRSKLSVPSPRVKHSFWTAWYLKMEHDGVSRNLVTYYRHPPRNNAWGVKLVKVTECSQPVTRNLKNFVLWCRIFFFKF
jgi:hypothetical protein